MIWIWFCFACPAADNLQPPSGMILHETVGLLAHPKAPPTMTFMKKSEQPTTEEGALSRNTVGLESCGKNERQNLGLNRSSATAWQMFEWSIAPCGNLYGCSQSTVSTSEALGFRVANPSRAQRHNHQSQPPGFNSDSLTRAQFIVNHHGSSSDSLTGVQLRVTHQGPAWSHSPGSSLESLTRVQLRVTHQGPAWSHSPGSSLESLTRVQLGVTHQGPAWSHSPGSSLESLTRVQLGVTHQGPAWSHSPGSSLESLTRVQLGVTHQGPAQSQSLEFSLESVSRPSSDTLSRV